MAYDFIRIRETIIPTRDIRMIVGDPKGCTIEVMFHGVPSIVFALESKEAYVNIINRVTRKLDASTRGEG